MFDWLKRAKRLSVSRPARKLPINPALFEQRGASLYEALSTHWASSDPTYMHRAMSTDVEALEKRYALQLPEDFRDYLIYAAPSTTFMDDFGTQWWAPTEIKSIPDECPDEPPGEINTAIEHEKDAYLIFSDYLIWCYAWAICCSKGPNRGKIALIGGLPDTFVADNFRDFLLLELTNDLAIHQGSGNSRFPPRSAI